jgi:phospholipid/cholesterol/gamma-HCH transport system substrate-binding protein
VKYFSERNPLLIGALGVGIAVAVVTVALQYDKLPFINDEDHYAAYFVEAGGLRTGAAVQVAGYRVGQVDGVTLDRSKVLVTFSMDNGIRLGRSSEAAVKTKSILGAKVLEITPRGEGQLEGPIPADRTTPAYQLPDALGELSDTIEGLQINQVSDSLSVLATTFADTPPDLRVAVEGVKRFSETLNARDQDLRRLLANANKVTSVLAAHTDQVVSLIADSNALLSQLLMQSQALDHISASLSVLAQQLSAFIADNRTQLRPALDKVNGVLTIIDNRKERLQESIKLIGPYTTSLGEAVSSGPFFKNYIANLLPGQFVQPFVDAAFSDLGLDPHVLLPSQRTDPPVGQPGAPALPVPYPRTGQGGPPNLTLPDAITGNPGDARYPYREPLPAPPPGGPPPGPPAAAPPNLASVPEPTPSPVFVPAPGEPQPNVQPTPAPEG